MPRYLVNHSYHYRWFHLLEGETVELSEADADFITRDAGSAITLQPDDAPLVSAEELDAAPADTEYPVGDSDEPRDTNNDADRALGQPPADRMKRKGKVRERRQLDRESDPESGSAGAMSGKPFGGRGA